MWTTSSHTPARELPRTPAPMKLRRKAGPQLLAKPSSSSASRRESWPCRQSSAVVWAPEGYPPSSPASSGMAQVPRRRNMGPMKGRHSPCSHRASPSRVSRPTAAKKGKREGITVW